MVRGMLGDSIKMKNNNNQNSTNEISIMTVEKEGESITQKILKLPKLLTAEETRRMWVKARAPPSPPWITQGRNRDPDAEMQRRLSCYYYRVVVAIVVVVLSLLSSTAAAAIAAVAIVIIATTISHYYYYSLYYASTNQPKAFFLFLLVFLFFSLFLFKEQVEYMVPMWWVLIWTSVIYNLKVDYIDVVVIFL
jgi:hypothetical protein